MAESGLVNIAVVDDAGERVLAVCVKDLKCDLCKSAAPLTQVVSPLAQATIELHDFGHLPEKMASEIRHRRRHLKSQVSLTSKL